MNRLLLPALMVLTGCGLEQGRDLDRVPLEKASRTDELRRPLDDDGIIIGNALSTQSLMFNALTTSRTANAAVTANPLSTASFSSVPALRLSLQDPAARELMGYLVGCALPETASVSWTSPSGAVSTFKGLGNLCPAWATGPASTACQQIVSACLLARNNALGYRVPLSVRGDDAVGGITMQAGKKFMAFDYANRTTLVASLTRCSTPLYGASRNCGWERGLVRSCTPGTTVTVAAGAPAASACATGTPMGAVTSGDMVLRACSGLSACDSSSTLGQSEGYECSNYLYKPTITFACPATGTFNVMAAPYASSSSGSISLGELNSVPAMETSVFAVREGAFYGNLFDPSALSFDVSFNVQTNSQNIVPPLTSGPKVVYQSMYACSDNGWLEGEYQTTADARSGRVCTLGHCASNDTGRCLNPSGAKCSVDSANDGEFRQCVGGGASWSRGLTTFLNQRCDLTSPSDPKKCLRVP